jgi:hypothetical protein
MDIAVETNRLNLGRGEEFDRNTFNRMFDAMKAREPSNGVQLYSGMPASCFSSGGLAEDDTFGNLTMNNGLGFSAGENLISGYQFDPTTLNIDDYRGLPTYGVETKLTQQEMASKMADHHDDRYRLGKLTSTEFTNTPTEIELAYNELFKANDVEGLASSTGT